MAEPTETTEATASTERLVFFSDGVIAIAITLLVLDIRLPELPEHADSAALGRGAARRSCRRSPPMR